MDSEDLENYLEREGIWHRFIDKPETIHTKDAAEEAGVELKRLTKSLVMLDQDNNPILAIIPGDCRLDFEKVKGILNVEQIRMARMDEAGDYSGYPPGGTPMVHHKTRMKVVLDEKLAGYETIFGGGGSRDKLLELKTEDVIRLNGAEVGGITE